MSFSYVKRVVKLCLSLVVVCAFGISLAIGVSAEEEPFDKTRWGMAVSQGHTAMNARQFQYAIDRLNEALGYGPKGADLVTTHFLLGQSWFALLNNEKGVEHYKLIIDALVEADMKQDERFGDLMTAVAGTIGSQGLDRELAEISEHAVAAEQPSPDWIMKASDLSLRLIESEAVLPKKIGAFHRTRFQLLGRDWSDIAIHYETDEGEQGPRLSLYISHYPATGVSEHFSNAQTAIRMASPGNLKSIEEDAAFRPAGRDDLSGSYGRFRIKFAGRKTGTEILIFSINGWHFKLRSTYSWKQREKTRSEIRAFVDAFPWPSPLTRSLALPATGAHLCKDTPDPGEFYGKFGSLEAVLTVTLTYAGTDRTKLPSPANSPEAFCLRDRFAVGDQVVDAYRASEPQGDEGVYYRFELSNDTAFAQVASSKELQNILSQIDGAKPRAAAVHIDFYGNDSVKLVGLFDGLPPYELARQLVAETIRGRSGGVAQVNKGGASQQIEIQLNENLTQDSKPEE